MQPKVDAKYSPIYYTKFVGETFSEYTSLIIDIKKSRKINLKDRNDLQVYLNELPCILVTLVVSK